MKIITKDLFEASYLMAKGMHLKEVSSEQKTILFQFEGESDLNVLKNKYDAGRAEVNVRRLRNSLNVMREILFEKRQETLKI